MTLTPPVLKRTLVRFTPKVSTPNMQRVLDAQRGPCDVVFQPGEYTLTQRLRFPRDCAVYAPDASILLPQIGRSTGHVVGRNCVFEGGDWLSEHTSIEGEPWIPTDGAVFTLGQYYGHAPDAVMPHNVRFRDISVRTNSAGPTLNDAGTRCGGYSIFITGGCQDIHVQRVSSRPRLVRTDGRIPEMREGRVIGFHWGCLTRDDPPRATQHPSGRVEDLEVDDLAGHHYDSSGLGISGVSYLDVSGVRYLGRVPSALVLATGDFGWSKSESARSGAVRVSGVQAPRCTMTAVRAYGNTYGPDQRYRLNAIVECSTFAVRPDLDPGTDLRVAPLSGRRIHGLTLRSCGFDQITLDPQIETGPRDYEVNGKCFVQ